jgi:hypothetical protein
MKSEKENSERKESSEKHFILSGEGRNVLLFLRFPRTFYPSGVKVKVKAIPVTNRGGQ